MTDHVNAGVLSTVTAVVLEYREKECMVPMNINRRIQRVMHFQIPLRSFEAIVRLPPENAQYNNSSNNNSMGAPATSAYVLSSSPRSIPVSPIARKRVQLAFSNFSDDVLYQARDRLRQERAATLMGERELRIPRFNNLDCNEEIYLSCGKHCAAKVMWLAIVNADRWWGDYGDLHSLCLLCCALDAGGAGHVSKCARHSANSEEPIHVL